MAIGTPEQLRNAARGVMARRSTQEETDTSPGPVSNIYETTQGRIGELARSRAERGAMGGIPQSLYEPTYKPYSDVYGQLSRSGQGLSSKGKYGGFYTSADLEQAIAGSALNFRQQASEGLRQRALERMSKVGDMYSSARKPFDMGLFSGTIESPKESTNYLSRLGTWYKEQSKPAEEYLKAAQQAEYTPLSDLAKQIAVQQYGMNPELAAAKFANLDSEMWKSQQDKTYMQKYGVPYDEYMNAQQQNRAAAAYEQTTMEQDAKKRMDLLAQETGFNPKTMAADTGHTVDQLYNVWYKNNDYFNQARDLVFNNNLEGAKQLADDAAIAGNIVLRDLIVAMIKQANRSQDIASNWDLTTNNFTGE